MLCYYIYDNTIFTSLEKNNENAKESKKILDSSYNQIFTPAEYNKLIGEHSLYNSITTNRFFIEYSLTGVFYILY